ncbi:VOC family protein [Phenylobacterium sp.]|jgi:catechol-2,3-dioxygenase|uniref:VOC family protein n=1 Tax=Phenylobacterium sp. TaxID=1871053 RepID=UPI0037CC8FDE
MSKPVKFAHVVYQTRRYEEMIAWYETVFGATVVHRDPALAFLTYDDEHHRFAFANLSVLNPGGGDHRAEVGVNHVAYTYASAGDLLSNYERLKAEGILPYWPIHHGPTLSMYYADPDGNRMELQVDACAVEAANAYMRSEAFAVNPIGVVYDPDNLLGRWKAGASEDELLTMPAGPPSAIPAAHGF